MVTLNRPIFGKKLIRIDGYTRNNLGMRIDDNVSVRKVNAKIEQSGIVSNRRSKCGWLGEYLPEIPEGHV